MVRVALEPTFGRSRGVVVLYKSAISICFCENSHFSSIILLKSAPCSCIIKKFFVSLYAKLKMFFICQHYLLSLDFVLCSTQMTMSLFMYMSLRGMPKRVSKYNQTSSYSTTMV